jgi:hypothetical protein
VKGYSSSKRGTTRPSPNYRECFAQFTAELQATTTGTGADASASSGSGGGAGGVGGAGSADAAGGEGLACVLPLLLPCPNWRNGVGSNREKLLVHPSPSLSGASGALLYLEVPLSLLEYPFTYLLQY